MCFNINNSFSFVQQNYEMIKQNLFLLLFFTINLTSVFSQEGINSFDKSGERHGVWEKNYPGTNQLRYQGEFVHGKEIDTFKYYKLNRGKSVLSATKVFNPETNFIDVTFFTTKGKLVSEGKMVGKKFSGKWVYYHKSSSKVMITEFYDANGKLSGERTIYFINGVVAQLENYKNGMLNGISNWYSEANNKLQESMYKDDTLNGKSIYYDNWGNISAEGNYKSNIKTGVWDYYKKGELIRKVNHDTQKVIFKKQ